ncbi:hypothetical protein GCM10023094_51650 [Rhodococcus olei]|uniref:DUF4185 domain-containing protein n=1 Tax=Rhodococcus olei TaxID=2161675 RepID=A0ABP8PQE5_9NOCA
MAVSATVAAVALSAASVTPASAEGGPCGQGGSGSLGGSGSATGSIGTALPWITGAPDGGVPRLTGRTKAVEMVTGPGSPNDTIKRFNVSGTDLGIMWDNGNADGRHDVLVAFGDTVGDCGTDGDDWRSNVLLRSSDTNLADGIRIDSSPLSAPNRSKQIIRGFGIPGEYTIIPTAGVAVGGVQYVRVMSVRSWDTPGNWTTLYSVLAYSTDNGENWQLDPATVRAGIDGIDIPGIPAITPGNTKFQMSAFVDGHDGYIYEYGTPSGRHGSALLARVPGTQIRDLTAYRYWNGSTWVADLGEAVPVIESPVSELSVQWNSYLNKYVAMYTDTSNSLVIRQADRLEGPWSGTQTILSGVLVPSLYGGFMHPWTDGRYLEFVATTWDRYNVIYFRTDLDGLQMAATDQADRPDPATTGQARLLGVDHPEGDEVIDGPAPAGQ